MKIKTWNIEAMTGYKPFTTFYDDLTLGEMFGGANGIKETYRIAFKHWHDNYKYMTELVMALNWHVWNADAEGKQACEQAYLECYEHANEWCRDNLEGDELEYYYCTTD